MFAPHQRSVAAAHRALLCLLAVCVLLPTMLSPAHAGQKGKLEFVAGKSLFL
jgi:hypothetical protein